MYAATIQPRTIAANPQGLGSILNRNWFSTEGNHRQAAGKLEALKGYITMADIQRNSLNNVIASVGAAFPAVVSAKPYVDAIQRVADRARALIQAAKSKVLSSSYPSDPPPDATTVEDWRESWFADLDALDRILPEFDEARIASTRAIYSLQEAATRELAKRGERTDVMVAPKTTPPPVNWNINNVVVPEFLKPLAKAASSIGNLDIGGGLTKGLTGAVAIGGVVLVLWMLSKSGKGGD